MMRHRRRRWRLSAWTARRRSRRTSDAGEPRRLEPTAVWKMFQRYSRRAGLAKQVHPHMLRHTMATTLLANGCPIGHIRELLGHAQLATTCKYYLGRISER